jgi:uncharacterized protein (TIGR01244 family)
MRIIQLEEHLAVAGQILPEHVADIAAAGFKVLINNRPDGEEAGQPTQAEIAAAAEVAGLEYHYMPVNAMNYPGPDLPAMKRLFDDADRPVLAFCRTGTRCTNLWISSRDPEEREQAMARAAALGFDTGMASR